MATRPAATAELQVTSFTFTRWVFPCLHLVHFVGRLPGNHTCCDCGASGN